MVHLSFGEWQRHTVIGEKHHNRVFSLSALVECFEDFSDTIIGTPHTGIVQGEFLSHRRIVEKKTGDRHFIRLKNPRRHMWILATALDLTPKRLVRIRNVHHETKRFASSLGLFDSISGGNAERLRVLVMPLRPVR